MDEFKDVYSVVCIYDPTAEGCTRQMMVERYVDKGSDVTAKVVAEHTRLLLNVVAINQVLAILEESKAVGLHERTSDMLQYHHLQKAQSQLELFEERFYGIKNYRNYRTPFK